MKNHICFLFILLFILITPACNDNKKKQNLPKINNQLLRIIEEINKESDYLCLNIEFYFINDTNFIYFIPSPIPLVWINRDNKEIQTDIIAGHMEHDSIFLLFQDIAQNGIIDNYIEKDQLEYDEEKINNFYQEDTPFSFFDPIANIYYIKNDSLLYLRKKGL
ncbi:MAG: hypothetical protein LUG18_01450 [Candidatus Azobacteroides sp.]|nr:hypothetical protein [Candidatus Azobacteroides sp.]